MAKWLQEGLAEQSHPPLPMSRVVGEVGGCEKAKGQQ